MKNRKFLSVTFEQAIDLNIVLEAGMSELTRQKKDPHLLDGQRELIRVARNSAKNFRRRLRKATLELGKSFESERPHSRRKRESK